VTVTEGAWSTTAEGNARTAKLAGYDRMVRPSSTVNLHVGLHLLTINYLVCMTDTPIGEGIYIYIQSHKLLSSCKML
jgi:hypothetical protein